MSSGQAAPICLWSGPRNVSTALMYSFAELPEVLTVDEPLYGHYLFVSGAPHPGRDDVIAAMDCDGAAVMRRLIEQQATNPVPRLFVKHMAHHLVDLDLDFLEQTCNVFLIRDPLEMLPSLTVQVPNAKLADTGLKRQSEVFDELRSNDQPTVVVDSRELLVDPAGILRQLCEAVQLQYSDSMLEWPAGAKDFDGIWAPHWYHAVHRSTGFQPYVAKSDFPDKLLPLLEECRPWYQRLYAHALRAS